MNDIDQMAYLAPNQQTFFFYDLETSGLDPKNDRIMQFAGIRTDLNFNQIGEPINKLVKLSDDTLPSPSAIQVTKITPQLTQLEGMTEPEFCQFVQNEIFTPNTIVVGYNSVRFDDEHMRYTFYRNFYDAYEWQWKDGRSRWDLLDVVRMTRALRPEGINWPVVEAEDENGTYYKPANRLEYLTRDNGIIHEHAHDALSDVLALISVTKLISEKQPKLYNYLLKMRDKKNVAAQLVMDHKTMFVYSSGRYSSKHMNTSVIIPICKLKNGNVLVFDLRHNLEEKLEEEKNFKSEEKVYNGKKYNTYFRWSPIVKELAFNKCPAISPLGVLDSVSEEDSNDKANPMKKGSTGWDKIHLTREQVEKNLEILNSHPEFIERMKDMFEKKKESYEKSQDVDAQLYESFIPNGDKLKIQDVRNRTSSELADYEPIFEDERLSELLLHYKGRNFQNSLNEDEQRKWEQYRLKRLRSQEQSFISEIERMQKLAIEGKPLPNGNLVDESVIEDLLLWYQSLASADYE